MWHRLTGKAREAVYKAQKEAERLGDAFIAPEHILLALVSEVNIASKALESIGVSLDEMRASVESQLTVREPRVSPEMSLAPEGKLVLDSAFVEADSLNQEWIGTEHLMLGCCVTRTELRERRS